MFQKTPAGFDQTLLQTGQGPSVDPLGQHEPPPEVAEVVRQDAQLQAQRVRFKGWLKEEPDRHLHHGQSSLVFE